MRSLSYSSSAPSTSRSNLQNCHRKYQSSCLAHYRREHRTGPGRQSHSRMRACPITIGNEKENTVQLGFRLRRLSRCHRRPTPASPPTVLPMSIIAMLSTETASRTQSQTVQADLCVADRFDRCWFFRVVIVAPWKSLQSRQSKLPADGLLRWRLGRKCLRSKLGMRIQTHFPVYVPSRPPRLKTAISFRQPISFRQQPKNSGRRGSRRRGISSGLLCRPLSSTYRHIRTLWCSWAFGIPPSLTFCIASSF